MVKDAHFASNKCQCLSIFLLGDLLNEDGAIGSHAW